jgi:hypothetical protein
MVRKANCGAHSDQLRILMLHCLTHIQIEATHARYPILNFRLTARIRASRLPIALASFGSQATRGCDLLSSAIAILRAAAEPTLPIGIVSPIAVDCLSAAGKRQQRSLRRLPLTLSGRFAAPTATLLAQDQISMIIGDSLV